MRIICAFLNLVNSIYLKREWNHYLRLYTIILKVYLVLCLFLYFTLLDNVASSINKYFKVDYSDRNYALILRRKLMSHPFFSSKDKLSGREITMLKHIISCRSDQLTDEERKHDLYQHFKNILDCCHPNCKKAFRQFFSRQVKIV